MVFFKGDKYILDRHYLVRLP